MLEKRQNGDKGDIFRLPKETSRLFHARKSLTIASTGLAYLVEKGVLRRNGQKRGTYYTLRKK